MTIQVGVNGIATSYANDNVMNGFPNVRPAISYTGIAAQETTLLETQKYNIDIFADFQNYSPKEFPLITILSNVGGGVIDRNFDMWTSSYEGGTMFDVALDELRVRDSAGDYSASVFNSALNKPIAIGTSATALEYTKQEVGGKFFWQYASISAVAGGAGEYNTTWSNMADSIYIKSVAPTDKTAANLLLSEIKDLAPVASGNDMYLTLAQCRVNTSANYLSDTRGRMSEVIGMYQNILELKGYVGTKYTGCTVNGVGSKTLYEYKYTANTSHRVDQVINNIHTGLCSGLTVATKNNIETLVGIDRFIFSADMDMFIIVLNFYLSNIDYLLGTDTAALDNAGASFASGYYQLTRAVAGATADVYPVGSIFRVTSTVPAGGGAISAIVDRNGDSAAGTITGGAAYLAPVRNVFLLEEVSTADKVATVATRPFAANIGSTRSNTEGWTRFGRHVTWGRDDDVGAAAAELDPFDVNVKSTMRRHIEQLTNNIQIMNSKPYAVSVMRQNTGVRFGDTIERSRAEHLKEYKRMWTNIFLYGKKSDQSESELNYKGTTSGFFDYELFPVTYIKHPLPIDASGTVIGTERSAGTPVGMRFKNWIDELCKACQVGKTTGNNTVTTVLVGIDFMNIISTAAALIGTSDFNVFGVRFEKMPTGNQTLGLDVYAYRGVYGELRFQLLPELSYMSALKVPNFLFPSGRRSPRWTALAIDKTKVSIMTRKGREEKIYGNLQSNDNPFVSIEGISGAHLFKMKDPACQLVIDMEPNY